MSFNVNLKSFKNLLQKVYSTVPVRTPYPVLLNLKFVIGGGQLKVYATDMDTFVVAQISIDSDEEKKFVVNAKKIYDWTTISSNDDNQNISIDINDISVVITRGKSKSAFACVDINDYPEFPQFDKSKSYEFPAEKLKYVSGRVSSFAALKNESRNRGALEGVLFDCFKDKVIFVATDAHKLSIVSFNTSFGFNESVSVIVPPKPLNEVVNIIESSEFDNVKVSIFPENISFFSDDFELVTKLFEGPYPDYNKVIPTEHNNEFSIERQDLINSLKIAASVADKTNNLVKLCLEGNELCLRSEDTNTNSRSDEFLSVDYPNDDKFVIGFNANLLIEILSVIDTQKVKFEFINNTTGSVIKPVYSENSEDKNILFLLMPLRFPE